MNPILLMAGIFGKNIGHDHTREFGVDGITVWNLLADLSTILISNWP